ncbi:AGAP010991-PA-like protein [Anopheles sinensis]|uniref:AGAP010991-PA-like protein n=1 Tax=Anopheles sinensis TaxID=74873 RepID=A0A084W994_ANOSI|nr:AGAP010991-PA-like protein [Anopheles sinensis]
MNTGYFVRLRDSENWIYNRTFDFCEFLKRPSIDRFSSLVYAELRRHGRMPARCPIPKARYSFTNNTLLTIRLPSYLPETSFGFTVNLFFTQTKEFVFRSFWYGRLKKVLI